MHDGVHIRSGGARSHKPMHTGFCTGTMGELAGVVKLDGRPIGDGAVGKMTIRLTELYAKETAATGYSIFK